jgi:hypothetical protein
MNDPLADLAAKAAGDPFFIGFALAEYARAEGLTDDRLAGQLGCPVGNLTMLRLCRAPRPDPDGFRADVERVAGRFGADAGRLAAVVRQVEGVIRLRDAGGATAEAGFLLAARDGDPPGDGP